MPVFVENIKTYRGANGYYIGRSSDTKFAPLANPYTHLPLEETKAQFQVATREEAIQKYREWVRVQWEEDEYFRLVLTNLVWAHLRGEEIHLVCFCAPKSCHGDVLKELIEHMALLGIVTLEDEFADKDGDLPF